MTPEERKGLTMELAERVRALMRERIGLAANVRCVFYKRSTCLVIVHPKLDAGQLNYWQTAALNKGIEFYLTEWIKNEPGGLGLFNAAKISVG